MFFANTGNQFSQRYHFKFNEAAGLKRVVMIAFQRQVIVRHQAVLVPIFRNMAQTHIVAFADRDIGNVLALQADCVGVGLDQS